MDARAGRARCHGRSVTTTALLTDTKCEPPGVERSTAPNACCSVADPEIGILSIFDLELLSSLAGLERTRAEVARRGHPPEILAAYLAAAESREDNGAIDDGVLNPRLVAVEERARHRSC